MLVSLMNIAKKNGLAIHEHTNGTLIVELPETNHVSPLLLSADDGATWCPDAHDGKSKQWAGRVSMTGPTLKQEITAMYSMLGLGSPSLMLSVAEQLQSAYQGKLSS